MNVVKAEDWGTYLQIKNALIRIQQMLACLEPKYMHTKIA